MTEQPADHSDHSASAPRTPSTPQTVRWTTPPTDGGERLDGRSVALVSADRVLTGKRGQAEGSLEVLGGADDAGARAAGRGGAILVRGREILAAGTAAELEGRLSELVPDVDHRKVVRLDLPGATLMPGLIETHDHLPTSGTDVEYPDYGPHEVARLTLNAARAARELLSEGVTSVQSLGARHYVDVALRDAVDAGDLRGPGSSPPGRRSPRPVDTPTTPEAPRTPWTRSAARSAATTSWVLTRSRPWPPAAS